MIENLTKENFWNEMQEKYPKAMKKFCDWIDNYKKENNWEVLFNGHKFTHYSGVDKEIENYTKTPKYHELPLSMQMGIFCQFQFEEQESSKSPEFRAEILIGESKRGVDYFLNLVNLDEERKEE